MILKQKIGYIRDSKETQSLGTKKECLAISRLLRQRLKIKARGHNYSEEAQAMASKSDRSWSLGGEAVIAGDATKDSEKCQSYVTVEAGEDLIFHYHSYPAD